MSTPSVPAPLLDQSAAAAATVRMLRAIGRARRWIGRTTSRRIIVYTPIGATVVYVAAGGVLMATDGDWKPTDTFSMVAGCLFFVIGTALAVTHELRQEEAKEMQEDVREMLRNQRSTLDHLEDKVDVALEDKERVPSENKATAGDARLLSYPADRAVSPGDSSIGAPAEVEPATSTPSVIASLKGPQASDEAEDLLTRFALEKAIEAKASDAAVANLLEDTQVFALGSPAGDASASGESSESDILHFTADDEEGEERVLMPIFTRVELMKNALQHNPEWQSQSVLEVSGGDLLANRDPDVTLAIDPWTPLETQLAPA